MLILYTIYVLIFIFVMLILGQINFNHKYKIRLFIIVSILYNAFMGYAAIIIYRLANIYFSNIPKGLLGIYVVPEVENWFNIFIGTFAVASYLACLIPINIYMCDKSKINSLIIFY